MRGILFEYELNPTTWVYLSSLLTIGIYFKFRRFWSVRNLDLLALIAFSPGLLLLYHGLKRQLEVQQQYQQQWLQHLFFDRQQFGEWLEQLAGNEQFGLWLEQLGYIWLFGVGAFFMIRLLLDSIVVRRPLLEPNLSASGLTFTGAALLVFLTTNVVNPKAAPRLEHVLTKQDAPQQQGPGYPLFLSFAEASDGGKVPGEQDPSGQRRPDLMRTAANRATVILGHLALVIGIVLIGYRHFDNIQTGVAAASLYLLLPYTAQMTARVDHVIPAALLVWAVQAYRRPVLSGILIGLAGGAIYYPLFLLPLWCGFYWRRGLIRFAVGVTAALVLLVGLLAFAPGGLGSFGEQLQQMLGWMSPLRADLNPDGFWEYYAPVFRIPVLAAFVAICGSLALWPAQKNLGTLLSCSAAVMLGTQFWHAHQGGICMAWYLPLLLLTIFRPNLEDRVAISALTEGWIPWRRAVGSG